MPYEEWMGRDLDENSQLRLFLIIRFIITKTYSITIWQALL